MKFLSWKSTVAVATIILGLNLHTGYCDTLPDWPPATDIPIEAPELPDWPPNTDSPDSSPEVPTGTPPEWPPVTDYPTTTTPESTTDGGGGGNQPADDPSNGWMVVAIIFIVLTVALAGIAIFLYVTLPKQQMQTDRSFVLPRANINN